MGRVVVVGGGVAGLTVAHELIERGYDVLLCEAGPGVGGKARSMPLPHGGQGPGPPLPIEHGFRFFPGFYQHLPDTLKRIPSHQGSVYDHLVPTSHVQLARAQGQSELLAPSHFPDSLPQLALAFQFLHRFSRTLGIPRHELQFFIRRLLQLMVSCSARRFREYEYMSWHSFIAADRMSPSYERYLAQALSRSLVALSPDSLSARTGGYLLLQFLFDFSLRPGTYLDRVLDGPTNDVWIDPWLRHLRDTGVRFSAQTLLCDIEVQGERITKLIVQRDGQRFALQADHYVLCLPVERLIPLLSPTLLAADPSLSKLIHLKTSWMSGVAFYLRRDIPIVHGHTNYIDSPWAITSISQPQFWRSKFAPQHYGDGKVRGILSTIVSNWDAIGLGCAKRARDCTPQELKQEVWHQIRLHLNNPGWEVLRQDDLLEAHVAPSMQYDAARGWHNSEPLLINTVGSWDARPSAETRLENLYLAGDFIRTNTDLATMESANEAARRAVNAIVRRDGQVTSLCEIWDYREPVSFLPLRKLDEIRFRRGELADISAVEANCFPTE